MCLLVSIPQTNSGLLFVMFMNAYDVDRQTASWPRTIHTATTSLMGFALGAIQHRVSIHSTILAGALLCPVAIIASAFVPNMAWMSVTLGLLYGAFRDMRGSYDNLYRMCGAVDLFAALMVSAQAFIDASKRRSNLQTCSSN